MCSILLASFSSSMIQSIQMRTLYIEMKSNDHQSQPQMPNHTYEYKREQQQKKLAHFDQIDQHQSKSVTISNDTINAS